ncbi:MAG: hypothetical protein QW727_03970 [Candidatus Pacearchaeota archaeon]
MNYEFFNKNRVIFILQGCYYCRKVMPIIERINMKLPIDKRIKIIDCSLYNNYGIIDNPLIEMYGKHFDGFPTLFIGNLKISGANTIEEYYYYLNPLLEGDYMVPEYTNQKFNKECEFKNKWYFLKRVVCK